MECLAGIVILESEAIAILYPEWFGEVDGPFKQFFFFQVPQPLHPPY